MYNYPTQSVIESSQHNHCCKHSHLRHCEPKTWQSSRAEALSRQSPSVHFHVIASESAAIQIVGETSQPTTRIMEPPDNCKKAFVVQSFDMCSGNRAKARDIQEKSNLASRPKRSAKSGISLIAVLMFMLAATTASIVLFRWLGSENLASGARLKSSEAFQASESGLDAVQAYLANRAADAGALITKYENQAGVNKNPILLTALTNTPTAHNVLGEINNARNQNFKVYLTGIDSKSIPMKLKFLSIGEARDGSQISQTAIFTLGGLYRTTVPGVTAKRNAPEPPAFNGSLPGNTQGKFSSAIINGDLNVNGMTTTGYLLVTGNMTTQDNGDKKIGCDETKPKEKQGDLYVVGNAAIRSFIICGNAYIGGTLTAQGPWFQQDYYAAGGVISNGGGTPAEAAAAPDGAATGFKVSGNMTLGANMTIGTNNPKISGNLVADNIGGGNFLQPQEGTITFVDGSRFLVGGTIWNSAYFRGTNGDDKNDNEATANIRFNNAYLPSITDDAPQNRPSYEQIRGDGTVHFVATGTTGNPVGGNKPQGALDLQYMADRIDKETGRVPDPLAIPQDMKAVWMAKGETFKTMANSPDSANMPKPCVRLMLSKNNQTDSYASWLNHASNRSADNFIDTLNACYAALNADYPASDPQNILYKSGSAEPFLVVKLSGTGQKSPTAGKLIIGNFVIVFEQNVSASIKLPATGDDSNVFFYLVEGATGTMALEGSRNDNLKRNYFIYSEKNIAGTSGSTTINGSVFLASNPECLAAKTCGSSGQWPDTDIDFNMDLYNTLLEAGIIAENPCLQTENPGACDPNNPTGTPVNPDPSVTGAYTDTVWIPVSSRLSVNLETKSITTEREPEQAAISINPSIVAMPRIVRIAQNEFATGRGLREFFTFIPTNGAAMADTGSYILSCNSITGKGSILTATAGTATNPEDTYRCVFNGSNAPISDFFVIIAGDLSSPKVSISGGGTIDKTDIGNADQTKSCKIITLSAEEANQDDGWQVLFSISAGNKWSVSVMDNACTGSQAENDFNCTIPATKTIANVLLVCPTTDAENRDNNIVLEINPVPGESYQIDNEYKSAIITLATVSGKVRRIDEEGKGESWVDCPQKPETWATVACDELAPDVPNELWNCEVGSTATWTINPGERCESVSGILTGTTQNVQQPPTETPFTASLKAKAATVTISGGNGQAVLTTIDTRVPATQREITCAGTCEIWQGITYVVSSVINAYQWLCSADCSNTTTGLNNILVPEYATNSVAGHTLTAQSGSVTITLSAPPAKSLQNCSLIKASLKIGQSLTPADITAPTIGGYGCSEEDIANLASNLTYYIDGSQYVLGSPITLSEGSHPVTVSSTVCGGLSEISCGNLEVAAASEPSVSCSMNKTTVNVGQNITATVTITNGTTKLCTNPAINGGFGTWGNVNGIPSGISEGAANVTFTSANATADNIGTYSNVEVSVVCGGETKTATCASFEIPAPPAIAVCKLSNNTNAMTVQMGADVNHPIVTCAQGTVNNNPTFGGDTPNSNNQWNNNGNQGSYTVDGIKNVKLTRVNCRYDNLDHWENVDIPCGTITVTPPTCQVVSNTANVGVNVNRPTIGNCNNENNRKYTLNPNTGMDNNQWDNGGTNKFTSAGIRTVTLTQVTCNNTTLNNLNIPCGEIEVLAPTVSCSLNDGTVDGTNSMTVTQGQNIAEPIIKCGIGFTPSDCNNFSNTPNNDGNNWTDNDCNNGGYAYYRTNDANGTTKAITASFKCNGVQQNNIACGTITVNKPTCSVSESCVKNEDCLAPTISCGNGALRPIGNDRAEFSNNNNWGSVQDLNSNDNWKRGNSSYFTATGSKPVYMTKIWCDDHELNIGNIGAIDCGTVNVSNGPSELKCASQTIPNDATDLSALDKSKVTCTEGGTRSDVTWTNPYINYGVAGNYYVYAKATCSGNPVGEQTKECVVTVAAAGGGGCQLANAVAEKQSITAGDCMQTTCNNGLRFSDWNNSGVHIKVTGGCTINDLAVPNSNGTIHCSKPGQVFIEVLSGSTTNFAIGCW